MHFLRAFGQLAPAESFDAINSTLFSDTPKIDPFTGMDGLERRGLRPRTHNRDVRVPETRRSSQDSI
jgi:hypothetical protein